MAGTATDIVGTVGVDVIPVAPDFHTKLKAMILPGADSVGKQLGDLIGNAMAAQVAKAIPRAISDGAKLARADAIKQGSSTGGAFADSLRAKLTAAFRAMPKLDIGLSDTGVDAQLARLRAKLEDLRNRRIGVDITTEDANAKISEIDERLARLGASDPRVSVRVDVATARAALADIRAEIDEASRNPLDIRVRIGQFRESLIAQVEAAQAALPVIEIDADTDPARQELDRYRAELAAIPTRLRTDANFNDAEAIAKVDELQAALAALGSRSPNIDVRLDAARAEAELTTIQAEVAALDGERVSLDFGSANAGAMELAINLAVLVAIPLVPVLGAGVGAIAAAFTAAGAAAGAFGLAAIPAVKTVTAAMAAQTAAKNDDTKATSAQANAGNTAAQQALSMASAQASLASAERSAAQSIHSADEQVATSQRALASAVTQAADQRKTALAGVVTAEKSLADAQRSSTDAEKNLVAARTAASAQLKGLKDQLADGDLSARAAELQVQRTQAALITAQRNPNTNPLDLADAQLSYDQAVQAQKEQAQSLTDLKKSAADQTKAGVDGNQAVQQAAEQLAKAQEDVADKTQAVADAQANVAKVAKSSAQSIADAQRTEADAYTSAANARVNAADSIASAERGIEAARLSSSKVTVAAATKEDAYQKALAKLSPTARDLFDALAGPHGLKSAFDAWSKSLQPDVLPIFTRGVNSAKAALPGLTPLVLAFADGVSTLYDKASRQLKNPFWRGFKTDIDKSARPAVVGLGVAFGNVFKGMAGIIDAFLPHMNGIAANMDRITGRFAKWGSGLKGSPDFENFLDYVKREGPVVAQFLGKILGAATDVAKALSPVSVITMSVLGQVVDAIAWLANNAPEVIKMFYALYIGSKLFALGMGFLDIALGLYDTIMILASLETWSLAAALEATGIPELVLLIVVVITALVLGFIELWKHVGWFRAIFIDTWAAIKVAALFLWNDVLKPSFHGIAIGLSAIGTAAVWLWEKALKPTFSFIWTAVRLLVTIFLTILITPVYLAVKYVLAPVFVWLWTHAIKPAFDGIGAAAEWLWKKALKPAFEAIAQLAKWLYDKAVKPMAKEVEDDLKAVGGVATWLWKNAIKPAFDGIADLAKDVYNKGLKPQFELIKEGIGKVGDSFKGAKKTISDAWSDVGTIAMKPVRVIVNGVYNDGIVPVWNAISKVTGVDQIHAWHPKGNGWATGGVLPGYTPGRDPHKFYSATGGQIQLSGGEAIMRPEFTRGVGAGFVDVMNRIASTQGVAGVQRAMGAMTGGRAFANGGIFGSIGNFAKSAVGKAADLGSLLADPGKALDDLLKSAKGALSGFTDTPWGSMVTKIPATFIKDLKDKAAHAVTGLFTDKAGGGLAPVGSGPAAAQAMARGMLKAFSWGGDQFAPLVKLWNGESGWNYKALNASSGAYGIPQALPASKMGKAGPDWRTNPHTQLTWGMGYIADRYGTPGHALAEWMARSPHWYDNGGFLPPGDHAVLNHTGKPEPVLTSGQWEILRANISTNRTPNITVENHTYLGTDEITDVVDHQIKIYDADLARGIDDGSRFL